MPPARKYFKKLKDKSLINAYSDKLEQISKDPYQGEAKVGDLSGIYCMDLYLNKTNYEIAYRVIEDGDKVAIIILAGTRENFYQELKRYMAT